jgi:plastocyanin
MGRFVAVATVVVALGALATGSACHLADTPDPMKCAAGTHLDTGRCVQDDVAANLITIAATDAGTCAVSPATITLTTSDLFQFENDDVVEHVVRGHDGQTWATVAAGKSSAFTGITKVGSWGYDVSGCAAGGTIDIVP